MDASILIGTAPSSPGMTGGIHGCFLENGIIVTGYQGFAVSAVLARHATAGPQHVDVVMGCALGAYAGNESFSTLEGPSLIAPALQ